MALDKAWRENNERLERIEKKLDALLSANTISKQKTDDMKKAVMPKEEEKKAAVKKSGKS